MVFLDIEKHHLCFPKGFLSVQCLASHFLSPATRNAASVSETSGSVSFRFTAFPPNLISLKRDGNDATIKLQAIPGDSPP